MKKLILSLFCCVAFVGYGQECISGDCENGQGTMIYTNGDNYVGKFSNDKKWGQGVMVNNDGRILYSGIWVDDLPYE